MTMHATAYPSRKHQQNIFDEEDIKNNTTDAALASPGSVKFSTLLCVIERRARYIRGWGHPPIRPGGVDGWWKRRGLSDEELLRRMVDSVETALKVGTWEGSVGGARHRDGGVWDCTLWEAEG